MDTKTIIEAVKEQLAKAGDLSVEEKVEVFNEVKRAMHNDSPFKDEPVDCVLWVKSDEVIANDYNPNKVAPPEMRLLEQSIRENGYTQPIVTWKKEEKNTIYRYRLIAKLSLMILFLNLRR